MNRRPLDYLLSTTSCEYWRAQMLAGTSSRGTPSLLPRKRGPSPRGSERLPDRSAGRGCALPVRDTGKCSLPFLIEPYTHLLSSHIYLGRNRLSRRHWPRIPPGRISLARAPQDRDRRLLVLMAACFDRNLVGLSGSNANLPWAADLAERYAQAKNAMLIAGLDLVNINIFRKRNAPLKRARAYLARQPGSLLARLHPGFQVAF